MLRKIISGGQTGADQGGLLAGKSLGIETGGTAPPGWVTDMGPQKEYLMSFGLLEGEPDLKIFVKRTIKNVQDADGTLWMGKENSPGGKLTLGTCRKLEKPFIINPTSFQLKEWIETNNIQILNVAGNRERRNLGICQKTRNLIVSTFCPIIDF